MFPAAVLHFLLLLWPRYKSLFLIDDLLAEMNTVLENDSTYAITLQTARPHWRTGISSTLTNVPARHHCECL
jgi:hypothetical protein